jgi:DNA-binding GntR family transcriptional regulator
VLPSSARAYDRIRELIVRGRLLPGERVSELDMAARLEMSRTPVREATRRLLQEGLLVPVLSATGARTRLAVAPVSAADVRELYHAAGALEGIAARGVAALAPAERRTLAAELGELQEQFREAATAAPIDYDLMFDRHDAFHRRLIRRCAGPRTRDLLETIRPQLDRYEWLYAPLMGTDFRPTFTEHGAIMRAVARGEPDAAEAAVRANWFNSADRLAAVIDSASSWLVQQLSTARRRPAP